ncbi:hypothetical protein [Nocardia seriolae]|uniref:hypothetical protein n=1 Tax=Nocardia seriolae TaxID=37332 RepID=UPI00090A4193|nr:hypothetical protein [Nocardia seriolae]MTJ65995.1 hypothetical protein [Nocardia seriolae]MTJ75647.1 hypothetical protein [Nocardia seriolae]MTJ86081.1 hypothetical protein [Nocardia seriolae]MTK30076.1 hypothetical protein [Nocardia seriolae]MTK43995.1 hypothetical protein [Nocardia seriolae]
MSGVQQAWDAEQIRELARRHRYDFAAITVYDPATGQPPLALLRRRRNQLGGKAGWLGVGGH